MSTETTIQTLIKRVEALEKQIADNNLSENNCYYLYINNKNNRDRIYAMLSDGDEYNGYYDNSDLACRKALDDEWNSLSKEEQQSWFIVANNYNHD